MNPKRMIAIATILCLAFGGACPPAEADDFEGLPQLKATAAPGDVKIIDQSAARAEAIAEILKRIRMPEGFKIALYALAPGARHLAVGPVAGVVFVGTVRNGVWAVTDRDQDGLADSVRQFAPAIPMTIPNGPCFSKDGALYVTERNRVLVYPEAEFHHERPEVTAFIVVEEGALIPTSEESRGHSARVCDIGPDNRLYIALGQPYNVSPGEKMDLYSKTGIGGIIRIDRDGGNREVYATGIRNSVGMDFNPANGELWFTDNQVDGMGDDIPPGEINRATGPGQHFGFPWFGGGSTRTDEYKKIAPPDGTIAPAVEMVAHAADLGMMFYTGTMFPAKYRGGIFSAQHGSWDRTIPIGARVMFTSVSKVGSAGETIIFAEGWLDQASGKYLGRPVDVAQLQDGSILVSDDYAGAIYRIRHEGP